MKVWKENGVWHFTDGMVDLTAPGFDQLLEKTSRLFRSSTLLHKDQMHKAFDQAAREYNLQ